MRLDDYAEKDGKRVWLTPDEIDRLIGQAETTEQEIALTLGGKAGLRRSEIVSVTPNDFEHGPSGFVRVWGDYAKRDQYREAPIPTELESLVRGFTSTQTPDEAVVNRDGSTVYRWLRKAAQKMQAQTGDSGWQYLDVHDLRRSWGGHLLWNRGVMPHAVKAFGGWSDWETFKKHYMGEISPQARDRERAKIFDTEDTAHGAMFEPATQGARETYMKS